MVEEKKEEKQEQAAAERKPEDKKPEEQAKAQEKPAPVAPTPQQKEPGVKKKKKINRLRLKELEKKIEEVKQKMGGLASAYAQQLLRRKEQLIEKPNTRSTSTSVGSASESNKGVERAKPGEVNAE